jgi:hypothetical protein
MLHYCTLHAAGRVRHAALLSVRAGAHGKGARERARGCVLQMGQENNALGVFDELNQANEDLTR